MPRARPRSGGVDIAIDPNTYAVTFDGANGRVHVKGHLWLQNDSPNFKAVFTILTGGFIFDDGTSGNAKGPIYTSAKPNPGGFSACGGVFTNLKLTSPNTLTLTISNNDNNKYFYQLNFLDENTQPATSFQTTDPIIVNN